MADLGADQQVDEPDTGSLTTDRQVATGPRLVLIVDQFEEIFTQCTDEQERRTFIKALCDAADTAAPGITADGGPARGQVDAREAPAVVVIGIRADFYARCTAYPELVPHLQNDQVLVGPIGEAGLREAIEKPAATAGLVTDAALVEVLLADLGLHAHTDARPASTAEGSGDHTVITGWDSYPAGRLALLSYALQQTWRNREGRRLTVAGYRATGGIDGAVAQAADNVCDRLDPAGQAALQRVLLRLVTFGEGTPDTRRRVDLRRARRFRGHRACHPHPRSAGRPDRCPAGHHRCGHRRDHPRDAPDCLAAAPAVAHRGPRRPADPPRPHRRRP